MEQLKFITCGSVDDGKSTLIGHMLYEAKLIFADQKNTLELDSKVSQGNSIDYSYLLDGLEDERKQGITIDVAYRFFKSEKRSFIVADCPGHEEYTHNMAVGANFADLALILIDVSKGLLSQTKRHIRICNMMGIRDYVFAINKMDLIDYNESRFKEIKTSILELLKEIEADSDIKTNSSLCIPVSATVGDNLVSISNNTKWYKGKTLLDYLENIKIARKENNTDNYILPVQRVSRYNNERYYQGTLNSGVIHQGDEVLVLPSNTKAKVKRIVKGLSEVDKAEKADAISICLDKELDISRGNVLVKSKSLYESTKLVSKILLLNQKELRVNNHYRLKLNCQSCEAIVRKILYKIDINTLEKTNTDVLKENEIAVIELELSNTIVFDKFSNNKEMGEFILIDYLDHSTCVYGTVLYPLEIEGKVVKQDLTITRKIREERNGNKAYTLFFTGLSCSGKSTLADAVEKELFYQGINTMVLDGDNMRMGLCKDLGFSKEDRSENIRRAAEVAKLLNDAGVTVISSFVSPFKEDREIAREIIGDSFIEVFVEASVETCMKRDRKGNYEKALRGEIKNFTGVSSPYEKPINPEIKVNTDNSTVEECKNTIIAMYKQISLANKTN